MSQQKVHPALVQQLRGYSGHKVKRVYGKKAGHPRSPHQTYRFHKAADSMMESSELQFEQAMAEVAFRYINDRVPTLMDSMIGFQMLRKSEDNKRAVGVFGFKLGENWLYVPVFFLRGMLKGYHIMYLPEQQQFLPLTEGWVNFVTSHKPVTLGFRMGDSLSQRGVGYPQYTRSRDTILTGQDSADKFGASKTASKTAQEKTAVDLRTGEILCKKYNVHKLGAADASKFVNQVGDFFTLEDTPKGFFKKALAKNPALLATAFKAYSEYPEVELFLDTAYGTDLLKDAALTLRDALTPAAGKTAEPVEPQPVDAGQPRDDLGRFVSPATNRSGGKSGGEPYAEGLFEQFLLESGAPYPTGQYPMKKVKVIVKRPDTCYALDELVDGITEDLENKGYFVRDDRGDSEVAHLVRPHSVAFQTPARTGFYNVLMHDGSLKPFYIAVAKDPDSLVSLSNDREYMRNRDKDWAEYKSLACLVSLDGIKGKTGRKRLRFASCKPSEIYAIPFDFTEDFDAVNFGTAAEFQVPVRMKWDDDAEPYYERMQYPWYVLFKGDKPDGHVGFGPFCIERKISANEYEISVKNKRYGTDSKILLVKDGTQEGSVVTLGNQVIVSPKTKSLLMGWGNCYADGDEGMFGTPDTLLALERMKKAGVYVQNENVYFDVPGEEDLVRNTRKTPYTKLAALIRLVEDPWFNLREGEAREILGEAEKAAVRRKEYHFVFREAECDRAEKQAHGKQADLGSFPMNVSRWNPNPDLMNNHLQVPPLQQPAEYPDPLLDATHSEPVYQTDVLPDMNREDAYDYFSSIQNPLPDPIALQVAQQAATTGQQDVMDTAALAAFLQDDLDQDTLNETIKMALKCLNNLGKMNFQLYWHYDEMEEYYGASGITDIEKGLENTFEDLGELTLKLKQTEDQTSGETLGLDMATAGLM